jgi:arylsulfatase A-like enzyme
MNNYKTGYISSQNEKWGDMINWLEEKGIDYFYHSENYDKKTWYNKDDKRGLGRLIKEKIATAGKIEDSETLRIAKNWITGLADSESFFLGMNLQNTHFNYLIPEGGEEPFQPSVIDFPMVYYDWPKDKAVHVRNRYYNAFYNLDKFINDFVDFLKREGIWNNCYFIIIGDSGEAFYEHGFANHSGTMYDEIIRTFTLIKPPKGIATAIIEKPISHIDLFPTLLDLMKLKIPDSFQGYSVFAEIESRHIFVHNNSFVWQDGIVEWPWKLLKTYHPFNERIMFNLENDPEEINEVSSVHNDKADELESMIDFWHSAQLEYYQKPEYYIKYNPPKIP